MSFVNGKPITVRTFGWVQDPGKFENLKRVVIQYGITDVLDTSFISWSGRLGDLAFLERLYDLKRLPSHDSRFSTAEDDIWQHTVNNDDWDKDWVFTDSRFKLTSGNDDDYLLKFICEMFHPAVRREQQDWQLFLDKINQLLNADGYELYERNHISGRSVYGYREIDHIETDSPHEPIFAKLKTIGNGSYAVVSKYYDARYDKWFALKSANSDLNDKERNLFPVSFLCDLFGSVNIAFSDDTGSEDQRINRLVSNQIIRYTIIK